jgi:hypothetical protein
MKLLWRVIIMLLLCLASCTAADDVVRFSKKMYSALGSDSESQLAKKFLPEYNRLNANGTLGQTLGALYEMRLRDLKISIKHAKKMRKVLDIMQSNQN